MNRNLLDSYALDNSPSDYCRSSMDKVGFSSMNAAHNRSNPMKDLSRMIHEKSTTSDRRNEELHTANGERRSTFAPKGKPVDYQDWATE